MDEYDKEIARNFVFSTKKWLYSYLLDEFQESDPKYLIVKQFVKDVEGYQDAILEQLDKKWN